MQKTETKENQNANKIMDWGINYLQTLSKWHNLVNDFTFHDNIDKACNAIVKCFESNKLFACGNGGSACEASHFVGELVGRFKSERGPLPAICLNDNGGLLTCIANDYGSDFIFKRQFQALFNNGDVLVVFSTSGNSSNLIHLLESENLKNVTIIGLLGKGGGKCKKLVNIPIIVDSDETDFIQEVHLNILHYWCKKIDESYGL